MAITTPDYRAAFARAVDTYHDALLADVERVAHEVDPRITGLRYLYEPPTTDLDGWSADGYVSVSEAVIEDGYAPSTRLLTALEKALYTHLSSAGYPERLAERLAANSGIFGEPDDSVLPSRWADRFHDIAEDFAPEVTGIIGARVDEENKEFACDAVLLGDVWTVLVPEGIERAARQAGKMSLSPHPFLLSSFPAEMSEVYTGSALGNAQAWVEAQVRDVEGPGLAVLTEMTPRAAAWVVGYKTAFGRGLTVVEPKDEHERTMLRSVAHFLAL